jgi:hypothetical protein
MSTSCLNLINDLSKSVDKVNDELIKDMTDPSMKYDFICAKPGVTHQNYYKNLKQQWEGLVNDFINRPDKCESLITSFLPLYDVIKTGKELDADELILEVISSAIMNPKVASFDMDPDFSKTITAFLKILSQHCSCQMVDIFRFIIDKYQTKYSAKFKSTDKKEIIKILKTDYIKLKQFINTTSNEDITSFKTSIFDDLSTKLTGLYGFSVESELNRLIPDELGSLKEFFVKIITAYFNNLHPIIWAQMMKQMIDNVFIELPYTTDEIFRFVSKYILLNSGPFILKILQMVRPVLSPDLAKKYNLTKLTYPLMKQNQVNMILERVVYHWDMYEVLANYSASVGHVCKVKKADDPYNIMIIKIIKPLSIAQTCWEYSVLHTGIFDKGSCEENFVKNMLESNGRELNVKNEIANLKKGFDNYTATYADVFTSEINAKLTTINAIDGIIKPDCWFALAMTLAPGIPLSKLVEDDLIKTDTKYRAKLHRCLDLLIYKFFLTIIKDGFYHGDLHAGNIFFSYRDNQMTLIDFGAVGEINLFENNDDVNALLEIIVKSLFHDFDGIFDKMTILLNSKCTDSKNSKIIDMNSSEYLAFKEKLRMYHLRNVIHDKREKQRSEQYKDDIFSEKRIQEEKSTDKELVEEPKVKLDSVYKYLEVKPDTRDPIIENRDVLPEFTKITGDSEDTTSFPKALEMIIKFYAESGVNIAVKFAEFYEFQKAYALLLGVLHKVNYNSYRMGIALQKAIINWRNLPKLLEVRTVAAVSKMYWDEKKKFDAIEDIVVKEKQELGIPATQTGGSDEDAQYLQKYLKYKQKYLQLKNNANTSMY